MTPKKKRNENVFFLRAVYGGLRVAWHLLVADLAEVEVAALGAAEALLAARPALPAAWGFRKRTPEGTRATDASGAREGTRATDALCWSPSGGPSQPQPPSLAGFSSSGCSCGSGSGGMPVSCRMRGTTPPAEFAAKKTKDGSSFVAFAAATYLSCSPSL